MRIIYKSKEIGFCYGVKRAIKIATNAIYDPNIKKPIYLLGNLVHNHHINEYLLNIGIKILDGSSRLAMLDEINSGTVIFTAHGVSQKVRTKALSKGLTIIDATCPYVKLTFDKMSKASSKGHDILFIGKSTHPETEAALDISKRVYLVDNVFENLPLEKPLLCHQTTMSSYDIEEMDMLCKVSEKRQQELLLLKNHTFLKPALIIIIGDKSSNNSTKLYEIAKRINNIDVLFIDNISELHFNVLKQYQEISLFSGTSTPEAIVNELYNLLLELDNLEADSYFSKLKLIDYIK